MRRLLYDPVEPLLGAEDPALAGTARRDLLGEAHAADHLCNMSEAQHIVTKQLTDGRWKYSGGNLSVRSEANYDQLETYRRLGILVCKYGLNREHPAIDRAAAFLRSFQTEAGDYRGIYGTQYTPNYTAAITELLIRAGYEITPQVERAMQWLVSMRQDDGGWAIPTRTLGLTLKVMTMDEEAFEPDRSRPSSHLITGVVVRAFAAHTAFRHSSVAQRAGELLTSRFFTRDKYPDHAAPFYWLVFSYPFWWTDLLCALDSLLRCGYGSSDPRIDRGLAWFYDNQHANGLWNVGRNRPKHRDSDLWVALAVCRMLKRSAGVADLAGSPAFEKS